MNEADEAKVERSGFAWRRGWVGSGDAVRVARRAVKLCLEWPYGILLIAHLEAFLSYDVGSCLHTTYIIRVVKYWGLAVATHCIGMAALTCTCTYCQDSLL